MPIGVRRERLVGPLFVDSAAALGGDGRSWATAFRSLAVALKHAEPGVFGRANRRLGTWESSDGSAGSATDLRAGIGVIDGTPRIGS